METSALRHFGLASLTILMLAGCQSGKGPLAALRGDAETSQDEGIDATVNAPTTTRMVDRDVEAPEVFQAEDTALWDGRPSLGGVWVASANAKDPERVIMRNPANGKFVIGALFRRERDNPGPELQISSDAAAALGFLAGEPGKISVTALRREEEPAKTDASQPILDAAETVETSQLDPIKGAAAAIDRAEEASDPAAAVADPAEGTGKRVPTMDPSAMAMDADAPAEAAKPAATAKAAAAPAASGGKRFQIGIFSVETNAQRAVDTLTKAGIASTLRKEESQGKTFWSVTAQGDGGTLAKIKAAGFKDAYALKG